MSTSSHHHRENQAPAGPPASARSPNPHPSSSLSLLLQLAATLVRCRVGLPAIRAKRMRGKNEEGEKTKRFFSAYRLGVQEGRMMMPLTLLFLPSLWTEVQHRWMQRGEQKRGTERDRMQTPAAGVTSRENENEGKGGKKEERESWCCFSLSSLERVLYPCEPEGCGFT